MVCFAFLYSAGDWRYASEQFIKMLPDKVIVHRKFLISINGALFFCDIIILYSFSTFSVFIS